MCNPSLLSNAEPPPGSSCEASSVCSCCVCCANLFLAQLQDDICTITLTRLST